MRHALALLIAVGLGSALNYYAVTLMIWWGHYLPHRPKSRLREFHMGGHHALYPDSQHIRTARFLYGQGGQDSLVPMLPWLTLLLSVEWLLLPVRWATVASIQLVLIAIAHSCVHAQFHLSQARLEVFAWFRRAREVHALHHDRDVNFMVADHFWDRAFRKYEEPEELVSHIAGETPPPNDEGAATVVGRLRGGASRKSVRRGHAKATH